MPASPTRVFAKSSSSSPVSFPIAASPASVSLVSSRASDFSFVSRAKVLDIGIGYWLAGALKAPQVAQSGKLPVVEIRGPGPSKIHRDHMAVSVKLRGRPCLAKVFGHLGHIGQRRSGGSCFLAAATSSSKAIDTSVPDNRVS